MKNTLIILSAAAGIALTGPAFAVGTTALESQSKTMVEQDANGSYHKKRTASAESTDANGTRNSTETKVKVDTDADGNGEKTVTTETVTDPKGLMNKTKTVTSDTVKNKDGKSKVKHKKEINGTTVEEKIEETDTAK